MIAFAGSQFVPLGPLPSACVPNEDGQVAVVSRDKMVVYVRVFPSSCLVFRFHLHTAHLFSNVV